MKSNSPVLIVENCTSGLRPVNESTTKSREYILGGIFTEFNVVNRNERIYTAEKFLPHMNELLAKKAQLGTIYGEFDHPDVFDTSLARVSHTIEKMVYVKEHNRVEGEIRLLNTHWGKEAKALVDDGCPIFVSSRAAGITESNGEVTVKRLFTYDAVADPGFGNAKMELKSINESLGFRNESANFRIYELSEESKFNELIMDNKNNEFVTKKQMTEYSQYLIELIQSVSEALNTNLDQKDKSEVLRLAELFENLQKQQEQVSKYLDYLAENMQIVVKENKQLKEKTMKLESHNDYLASELENSINYTTYIAENLDKNIGFSEYIAENVDKTIKYSQYLAENLDKNIAYAEYIAENLDNNIAYAEYIAENLDNNIAYAEYIAENLDNNIAYAEYIAENVSDTQAYGNYLAEAVDKVVDKLKGKKLFENEGQEDELNFKVNDIEKYYSDEDEKSEVVEPNQVEELVTTEETEDVIEEPVATEETPSTEEVIEEPSIETEISTEIEVPQQPEIGVEEPSAQGEEISSEIVPGMNVAIGTQTGQVRAYDPVDKLALVKLDETGEEVQVMESKLTIITGKFVENEQKLSESIQKLINETKKRKASEKQEPHFFSFLTEKNKTFFNQLSSEDKEKVNVALNESKYYSESDVVKIMNESLAVKKTFEEVLIENMPNDLIPVFESLEDKYKTSLFAQASLYPNLNTPSRIEAFWRSRELDKYTKVKENKQVLNESKFIDNSTLSNDQIDKFLGRIQNS